MQGTASNNAPSSSVVIPHFITGAVIWLLCMILLFCNTDALMGHFFNFKLLSINHLLVLSWVTTIIFGALYQLLPVILLCKLYSERLAILSFIFLQVGSIGMSVCFWNGLTGIPLISTGSVVCLAMLFFGFNLMKTILRSSVVRIEKTFIATAVFWLFFTVLIGLLLAINFQFPFLTFPHVELLKVHAHFGVIGWFSQLIIGVASVLIPMFLLSHTTSKRGLMICYVLLNGSLLVGFFSKMSAFETGLICSLLMGVLGLFFFLRFIYQTYRARVKKKLDIGMKKSMIAFLFALLAIVFSIPSFVQQIKGFEIPETAYFTTLIIGFVSTLIMGQTYKTLPFIIWLNTYKSVVGKEKTPLPRDLYSDTIARWQYRIHSIGFLVVLTGITLHYQPVLQAGIGCLLIAGILYLKNVLTLLFHKRKHNEFSTY